jgi:error-prone DNA polymerase
MNTTIDRGAPASGKTEAHPLLAGSLDRTLGVPLFQEQVMQMAVDVASFTGAEADQLRRAMGAKRSSAKMRALMARFFDGCARNGLDRELATRIFEQIHAFSGYGFPEAHSMSFALLVYASAWFKRYYPAAFCAGLLGAQPMGFYSPQSLVADARRHGVRVREPDINASLAHATLEPDEGSTGGVALRLGLAGIRHLGDAVAEQIVAERQAHGRYASISDLAGRVQLKRPAAEALATAGAFTGFGGDRRQDLWAAGAAAATRPGHLPGLAPGVDAPALPGMTRFEVTAADLWSTSVSPDSHPVQYLRTLLTERGAITTAELTQVEDGTRVWVGGAVTHRQRPATAGGITWSVPASAATGAHCGPCAACCSRPSAANQPPPHPRTTRHTPRSSATPSPTSQRCSPPAWPPNSISSPPNSSPAMASTNR